MNKMTTQPNAFKGADLLLDGSLRFRTAFNDGQHVIYGFRNGMVQFEITLGYTTPESVIDATIQAVLYEVVGRKPGLAGANANIEMTRHQVLDAWKAENGIK